MTNLDTVRCMTPHERFLYFIDARERARHHKELIGGPGPHSDDPIIAVNRFCNVNREDDAVTRWIKANVRDRWSGCGRTSVLIQVLASRIFNEPATLRRILPVTDTNRMVRVLKGMQDEERLKIMRGAYMVGAHGPKNKGVPVREYYARVLRTAQKACWAKRPTLSSVASELCTIEGMGDFMANQVCTDLRYTAEWRNAPDWGTFVLCGPGSRRGLDRYDGHYMPHKTYRKASVYTSRVLEIREELRTQAHPLAPVFDDPNNLSNCFCEYDKYERVLHGEADRLHTYP